MPQEKKYWVKESWRFNLESMNDKLHCIIYDFYDGKVRLPIEIAGKNVKTIDDIYGLIDEVSQLTTAAYGRVTGKQYGRIKEIVNWRVTCLLKVLQTSSAGWTSKPKTPMRSRRKMNDHTWYYVRRWSEWELKSATQVSTKMEKQKAEPQEIRPEERSVFEIGTVSLGS